MCPDLQMVFRLEMQWKSFDRDGLRNPHPDGQL